MQAENLHVLPSHPTDQESTVKVLEWALELARAGELGAVGVAVVHRDGCTNEKYSQSSAVATLIGSVARLQHDLLNA